MNGGLPVYPFDSHRYMGTVSLVEPASANVNLPLAGTTAGNLYHGHRVAAGEVGEFVVIECDDIALFGRILQVRLPERERLSVEPEFGIQRDVHPVGQVQLLATLSLSDGSVLPGIGRYPRLGNRVFSANPEIVRWIVEQSGRQSPRAASVELSVATLPNVSETLVKLSPEQLFGRHCAILGSTGGGKSWSLARILEELMTFKSKAILFDATGEFHTLIGDGNAVKHVYLGSGDARPAGADQSVFPYSEMIESDLFAIFRPSGQSQAPKLRAAMKTLKLLKVEPTLGTNGLYEKAGQSKAIFENSYRSHADIVEGLNADFDVTMLTSQISHECVYPSANYGKDPTKWGDPNGTEYSWCVTLIYRIEQVIRSPELACVFNPGAATSICKYIDEFMQDDDKRVLRISLQNLPFANDAREIVANAIGRTLLAMAREGKFRSKPTVVFLDEAHQFLDKSVGDENTRIHLDSFGLIAKEGRKYGLSICIATQRPRDIPEDVLSQMGTLIVHRLINHEDRRVVERASGQIDRSAAEFLPTLGPGEAVVIGVDVPVPLSIKIEKPTQRPDSMGPDYQQHWKN